MNAQTSSNDREVLRGLASEIAEIAALPDHAETARRWAALNGLKSVRPMVRVYQLPWRELGVDGELELKSESEWARGIEEDFRRQLYQWKHMRWDMVIEPVLYVKKVIRSTDLGITIDMDEIPHDQDGGVTAKHYHRQISEEADIAKIKDPELSLDQAATDENFSRASEIFDGVLEVKVQGETRHNYSPWDRLTEWCNPQQILMDLIMRPDFVHAAVERITSAYMREMDQLEALGGGNFGVGQGGLGYIDELPAQDAAPDPVKLEHQWGGSQAQIFSEVSPEMHEEFALRYENRFLQRFGLAYYGCCEPLDRKVDVIARNIPNLRKISMSCWVDPARGAEGIAGRFVYSAKPNPAFLAADNDWDRKSARSELERILSATEGRNVELILKDVSTVRFKPRRVWEWVEMANAMAAEYEK
ncbi:MAG: hypothetical protein ACYTGB_14700 [Planctomycetota bacterium]|jgi:hypothetical protein